MKALGSCPCQCPWSFLHAQFMEGRVPQNATKIMKNGWEIGIITSPVSVFIDSQMALLS